jgi:two-component system, sensor histidine kinase and response regulator
VAPSGIMIVDDNPDNLKLLEDMLRRQGHEVGSFPLGRLALAAAMNNPPDLILLDINMPEMDGYQVCESLKSTAELSGIPVIFLSASAETSDKVKAFRSGAVDYISKPFQFEEVRARVETHLELHRLQRALQLQNARLEEAVAARTRELAEANERLIILDRSKNEFLNLISHEFRTPLNGLLGVGELILSELPPTNDSGELKEMFEHSRRRILSILNDALLLTQIDIKAGQPPLAAVSLGTALRRATEGAAEFALSRNVTLATPPAEPDPVFGDEDLLARALQALVETAVKFSGEGEAIRVARGVPADSPNIVIESRGRTVPSTALPKFFDLFSIGEPITPGGDLGLGPPLAHRILSLFGASVTVENLQPSGIRLSVSLQKSP